MALKVPFGVEVLCLNLIKAQGSRTQSHLGMLRSAAW